MTLTPWVKVTFTKANPCGRQHLGVENPTGVRGTGHTQRRGEGPTRPVLHAAGDRERKGQNPTLKTSSEWHFPVAKCLDAYAESAEQPAGILRPSTWSSTPPRFRTPMCKSPHLLRTRDRSIALADGRLPAQHGRPRVAQLLPVLVNSAIPAKTWGWQERASTLSESLQPWW